MNGDIVYYQFNLNNEFRIYDKIKKNTFNRIYFFRFELYPEQGSEGAKGKVKNRRASCCYGVALLRLQSPNKCCIKEKGRVPRSKIKVDKGEAPLRIKTTAANRTKVSSLTDYQAERPPFHPLNASRIFINPFLFEFWKWEQK